LSIVPRILLLLAAFGAASSLPATKPVADSFECVASADGVGRKAECADSQTGPTSGPRLADSVGPDAPPKSGASAHAPVPAPAAVARPIAQLRAAPAVPHSESVYLVTRRLRI